MRIPILLPLLLLPAIAAADVVVKPGPKVDEYRLVQITFEPEVEIDGKSYVSSCHVLGFSSKGKPVRVDTYSAEGLLLFTGPPGIYQVFGVEGRKSFSELVTIGKTEPEPEPDPEPDPKPDDTLEGLALEVRNRARDIGFTRELATRVGTNYQAVAKAIADNKIKTPGDAERQIERLNDVPRSTKSFFDWLNTVMNTRENGAAITDVQAVRRLFLEISKGLEALR